MSWNLLAHIGLSILRDIESNMSCMNPRFGLFFEKSILNNAEAACTMLDETNTIFARYI